MIPVEIQESSPRFQNFVAEESNEERKVNLDLLDEVREEARIKVEALMRRVEYQHNSKLKPRQFQVADLVMRKAHPYQLENKLSPKWTGPFRVIEALGNETYRLETLEGGTIPRKWNATNLKFYFSWTLALHIVIRGHYFSLIRVFYWGHPINFNWRIFLSFLYNAVTNRSLALEVSAEWTVGSQRTPPPRVRALRLNTKWFTSEILLAFERRWGQLRTVCLGQKSQVWEG